MTKSHALKTSSQGTKSKTARARPGKFSGRRPPSTESSRPGLTPDVRLYADGSTLERNPGPGGWGYYLCEAANENVPLAAACGGTGDIVTTNNRCEIQAIIEGLRRLAHIRPKRPLVVEVVSDSTYALGFAVKVASNARPVANDDLAKPLRSALRDAEGAGWVVAWRWVRGHDGNLGNEAADKLAKSGAAGGAA